MFEYRKPEYFNDKDFYLFKSTTLLFKSKVHFSNGVWWTNNSLQYKATTLPCLKEINYEQK